MPRSLTNRASHGGIRPRGLRCAGLPAQHAAQLRHRQGIGGMTGRHDRSPRSADSGGVDDILDLRNQILRAVVRRDAEPRNSPVRLEIEAEIDALVRRVWRIEDPGAQPREGVRDEG